MVGFGLEMYLDLDQLETGDLYYQIHNLHSWNPGVLTFIIILRITLCALNYIVVLVIE